MKQQVLDYLRKFPGQTTDTLVLALGLKRGSVSKLLTRLVRVGDVTRTTNNVYYLAEKSAAPSPAPQSANA